MLALLPLVSSPFQAKFVGPYSVLGKVSDQNYILSTRDRKKATQLCHINLLKPYFSRASPSGIGAGVKPVAVAVPFGVAGSHLPEAKVDELEVTDCMTQGRLKILCLNLTYCWDTCHRLGL